MSKSRFKDLSLLKKLLFPTVALGIGTITALILAEAMIRIVGPEISLVPVVFDNNVGITNQPGYSGTYNREGYSNFSINSDGWRDQERTLSKPKGTFRVAIVGDSYIEALQVQQSDMLSEQLEKLLNKKVDKHQYEVMSFGMSGFDAAQSYLTIKHKVMKYSPDLVIYAFLSGNDLRDSVRELRDLPWKPYFTLENGDLKLDSSFEDYVRSKENIWYREYGYFFRANSRLFVYAAYDLYPRLKSGYREFTRSLEKPNVVKKLDVGNAQVAAGLSGLEIYRQPLEGTPYDTAWNITERILIEMDRFCKEKKTMFMLFGVTNPMQVQNGKLVELPAGYDIFYPEKHLAKFAMESGLHYLPLAQDFANIYKKEGVIFHGTKEKPGGHWGEQGHTYAARSLANYLSSHEQLTGY